MSTIGANDIDRGVRVAVVIPSYKVTRHILSVIDGIGTEVDRIYVVDDACPDRSGDFVQRNCADPRVVVISHEENKGVGGAVITGYRAALTDGADVLVKVDGDGQMDGALIPELIHPILTGDADYTKGNRFYRLDMIRRMPLVRLVGNAGLSFLSKLSTGYWGVFDPTNGFTAIHARVAERVPLDKVSERFFFETDLLFRLGTLRAVVRDVPMDAVYDSEVSNLNVGSALLDFSVRHFRNLFKRIFYNYFLRDFSVASVQLFLGVVLTAGGAAFGLLSWVHAVSSGSVASAGTVMLAALPIILGLQFLLAFLSYDVEHSPRQSIHQSLRPRLMDNGKP